MTVGETLLSRAVGTARSRPGPRLSLVSEFQLLIDNRQVSVPHGVQRLLAFLAMAGQPVARSRVAGQLWLDVPEYRALGNLRSVLWRLRRLPRELVRSIDDRLSLDDQVEVDLTELTLLSSQLTDLRDSTSLTRLALLMSASEVLPGWEDEWIIVSRERFRELRLHALERACEALLEIGNHPAAVQAALAAIDAEPYRDSAQRLLVRVHLAEGNIAAALRSYQVYCDLMETDLGIEPSERMRALVSGLVVGRHWFEVPVTPR
jgi:DNA-binding SARP family transcriptional activator